MTYNIDFATIGLGENHKLPLTVSLPITAYNGYNAIMSTGQQYFSGGKYLFMLPSLMLSLSTKDYQAYIGYVIDSGSLVSVLNFAKMGNDQTLDGSVSFCVPVEISAGNHTVSLVVGTISPTKTITVVAFQDSISAYLVKVGV